MFGVDVELLPLGFVDLRKGVGMPRRLRRVGEQGVVPLHHLHHAVWAVPAHDGQDAAPELGAHLTDDVELGEMAAALVHHETRHLEQRP